MNRNKQTIRNEVAFNKATQRKENKYRGDVVNVARRLANIFNDFFDGSLSALYIEHILIKLREAGALNGSQLRRYRKVSGQKQSLVRDALALAVEESTYGIYLRQTESGEIEYSTDYQPIHNFEVEDFLLQDEDPYDSFSIPSRFKKYVDA